jgi:hypothetical protein
MASDIKVLSRELCWSFAMMFSNIFFMVWADVPNKSYGASTRKRTFLDVDFHRIGIVYLIVMQMVLRSNFH